MNKGMSIYLELIRVIATLLVLLSHASELAPEALQVVLSELRLGRDGVILFFVLSGYVITWCAIEKEKEWKKFAISRAARIYSVAIPGLLLGIMVSLFISFQQATPVDYTIQKAWIYYPLFLTFNSQSWLGFIFPAGNFPYWSLSFEVWYYVFFGTLLFARKLKIVAIVTVLLLMGPYIILFLPLWGLGSVLYFAKDKFVPSRFIAAMLFCVTFVLFIAIKITHLDNIVDTYNVALLGSLNSYLPAKQFLGDYLLAIIATVNFYAAFHLNVPFNRVTTNVIKTVAGFSFSIYMFHTPLLLLLENTVFVETHNYFAFYAAMLITLSVCYALSLFTEKKKNVVSNLLYKVFSHRKNEQG